MRPFELMFAMLGLFLLGSAGAVSADEAVRVIGTDGTTRAWAVAQVKETLASQLKQIEYLRNGAKHTVTAVPLLELLKASGAPVALKMDPKVDPKSKNLNLRLVVVVQSLDGYTATFSLAELLPEVGGREVWFAIEEDGKPLAERDGIAKLRVPDDKNPARWVRNIATITVINPVSPATRPATQPVVR